MSSIAFELAKDSFHAADAKAKQRAGVAACFSVWPDPGSRGSNQTLDNNYDLTLRTKRLLFLFAVALEPMLGLEHAIHRDRA
jgi:hypothetical protein